MVLPRPSVTVTETEQSGVHSVDVAIMRDDKGKTYRGESTRREDAVSDVVKKILNDPHTAEWLPEK